ncbi:MAG: methionine adenosyltransferase [Thermoguttaceae bacterium]|nr:methionine adenosyltransferase [Thermoguttaceae bacterium]
MGVSSPFAQPASIKTIPSKLPAAACLREKEGKQQTDKRFKSRFIVSNKKEIKLSTRLFTSEAVSMGHPDKVADRISDSILDAFLAQDPNSHVACETLVTTGLAVIAGEIASQASVDCESVVRRAIREIGYRDEAWGIDADTCKVRVLLDEQSPDIAQGVNRESSIGAGDQGLMFGYACNQTPELMPLPIALAHKITNRLTEARFSGQIGWLRPDSKSQVTVEYDGNTPVRIDTVVVSTQHHDHVSQDEIRKRVIEEIVEPLLPPALVKGTPKYWINPTGRFVTGGPNGDCGLTGRKVIVDTYGGWAHHGGGAFSGKDPTKVDRSAAYMARYIAKNLVAAGLADECEVQLAYAIGVDKPVSVSLNTAGSAKIPEEELIELVKRHFDMTPAGIIDTLNLRRPIYAKTSSGGHFGRNDPDFTWEQTNLAETLRRESGL